MKAHRIQREFNEKSKSDNYCQQTEMNEFKDEQKRMMNKFETKMNKLENKLDEILTKLSADKS